MPMQFTEKEVAAIRKNFEQENAKWIEGVNAQGAHTQHVSPKNNFDFSKATIESRFQGYLEAVHVRRYGSGKDGPLPKVEDVMHQMRIENVKKEAEIEARSV